MSTGVRLALRVVTAILCVLGVFAAAQRTVIATLDQPPGADGMTPIVRANIEAMAGLIGIERGTPRYDDVVSGSLEFERSYDAHRAVILLHVVPGGLILLLAPLQFSARVRRRYVSYHRWTGRFLLVCVLVSGIAALFFGLFIPFGGLPESVAVAIFGMLFLYAGARAWLAIRRRDVTTHREWMTRMFAVAVGIATTRVISLALGFVPTLTLREAFVYSLWAGFTLSVLVAEIVIRRARPGVARTSRRAPVADPA